MLERERDIVLSSDDFVPRRASLRASPRSRRRRPRCRGGSAVGGWGRARRWIVRSALDADVGRPRFGVCGSRDATVTSSSALDECVDAMTTPAAQAAEVLRPLEQAVAGDIAVTA